MKFLFRADAGVSQGTGHVMRCLTLAAELRARGHEVGLLTGTVAIEWLRAAISESGVIVYDCEPDELSLAQVREIDPDWLIVDSYRISADAISLAARHVAVLAIVDGDDRGVKATLFLDQNLGAESADRPDPERFLAGSRYALVRRQVLEAQRKQPWKWHGLVPNVLCFMGGTDATGVVVAVAAVVASLRTAVDLTVIAAPSQHSAIEAVVGGRVALRLLAPTPDLPRLFGEADVIVSAAGTSAWDICTLAIPAVFLAVVDNQRAGLAAILAHGLALGIDTVTSPDAALHELGPQLEKLLADDSLREQLALAARSEFDGRGAARVAERLESERVGPLLEWCLHD